MSECCPASGNNHFRISNIVPGENYTVSLLLRNRFGQSGESDCVSYGEDESLLLVIHVWNVT